MDLSPDAFCVLDKIKASSYHVGPSSWHKDNDISLRQQILSAIVSMLGSEQITRNAPLSFMLNAIAERFELTLYITSNTLEEYSNLDTLPSRIQLLIQLSTRA